MGGEQEDDPVPINRVLCAWLLREVHLVEAPATRSKRLASHLYLND